MKEWTDELARSNLMLYPNQVAQQVYSKLNEEYGQQLVTGMTYEQIVSRVSYVRKTLYGSNHLAAIDAPQISQLSADDQRYFLQFNLIKVINNELIKVLGFANPDIVRLLKYVTEKIITCFPL
jgi:hypothetical protein